MVARFRLVFFTVDDHGHQPLLMVPANGSGAIRTVAQGPTTVDDVQFTRDGKTMLYDEQSASKPVELHRVSLGGTSSETLTHLNDAIFDQYLD